MAQKSTTRVGAADSIVGSNATTMHTDNRQGSPCWGVISRKPEKTHPQNKGQIGMPVGRSSYHSKEYAHA